MAILNRNIVDDYSVVMILGSIVSEYMVFDATSLSDVVAQITRGDAIMISRTVANSKVDIINIENVELSNNAVEVIGEDGGIFDTMFIRVMGDDI